MARTYSVAWLVGLIVVLLSLGLSGFLIPARPCRTCDGLIVHQLSTHSPSLPPSLPRLDCPDCTDRGKVSLFKSWMRPQVADSIASVVRGCKDATGIDARRALKALLQNADKNAVSQILDAPDRPCFITARFIEAERKQYVILLVNDSAIPSAGVVLVSLQGQVLDSFRVRCGNREAQLRSQVLEEAAPDGAWIIINPVPSEFGMRLGSPIPLDLFQGAKIHGIRVLLWKGEGSTTGVCRLAVQGDRLEVLAAHEK